MELFPKFPEATASCYHLLTKREMLELIYARASDHFLETFDEHQMVRGNMVLGFKSNRSRLLRMLVALDDETRAAVNLHPHYRFVEDGLSIHALPGDALFAIFFQLEDFEQFAYLAQVCSAWNRLLKQNNCWENYLRDIFACFSGKTLRALQACGIQPVPYRAFFYKQLEQWGREIDAQHSAKLLRQLCGAIESSNIRAVRDLLQRGARACDSTTWEDPSFGFYHNTDSSPLRACLVGLQSTLYARDAKGEGDRERQLAILELLVRYGARLSRHCSYYSYFKDHQKDIKKLVSAQTWNHLAEIEFRKPIPFAERGWMYWQHWRRRGLAPPFTLNVWTIFPRPPKVETKKSDQSKPDERKEARKTKKTRCEPESSSFTGAEFS